MIDINRVVSIYCNDLKHSVFVVIVRYYDRKKDKAIVEIWLDDRENKIEKQLDLDRAIEYLQKDSDRESLRKNYMEYLEQAKKINKE